MNEWCCEVDFNLLMGYAMVSILATDMVYLLKLLLIVNRYYLWI